MRDRLGEKVLEDYWRMLNGTQKERRLLVACGRKEVVHRSEIRAGGPGEDFVETETQEGQIGEQGHGVPRERVEWGFGGEGSGRGVENVGQFVEKILFVHGSLRENKGRETDVEIQHRPGGQPREPHTEGREKGILAALHAFGHEVAQKQWQAGARGIPPSGNTAGRPFRREVAHSGDLAHNEGVGLMQQQQIGCA